MNAATKSVNTKKALSFLKHYTSGWPECLFVQIIAINPVTVEGVDPEIRTETASPATINSLTSFIEKYQTWNLYFGVNPLHKAIGVKAKKQHIAGLVYHHVDLDPPKVVMTPAELAAEKLRLRQLIANKGLPAPTFILDTGNGVGAYWRRQDPIAHNDNTNALEDINRRLATVLGGDNCHNLDRIMRLPHTINHPDHRKLQLQRPTSMSGLLEHNDVAYDQSAFDFLSPVSEKVGAPMPPTKVGVPLRLDDYGLTDEQVALVAGTMPKGGRHQVMRSLLITLLNDGHSRDDVLASLHEEPGLIAYCESKRPNDPASFALYELEKAWVKSDPGALARFYTFFPDFVGTHLIGASGELKSITKTVSLLIERPLTLAVLTTPIPPWPSVIGSFLPSGVVTETDGAHGIGKSALGLHATLSTVCGVEYYGFSVNQSGKAVFMSKEDPYDVIVLRIQSWLNGFDPSERPALQDKIQRNLTIYGCDETEALMLTSSDGRTCSVREDVVDLIVGRWQGVVLVVMETASLLHGGDELNEDLLVLVAALKRIASQLKAALNLIRHISKSATREGTEDSLIGRGGASFSDAVRSVTMLRELSNKEAADVGIDLSKLEEGSALLKWIHTKNNYGKKELPFYILRKPGPIFPKFLRVEPRGELIVNGDRLLVFLRAEIVGGNSELSYSAIRKQSTVHRVAQPKVKAALDHLVGEKKVTKIMSKNGKYEVYLPV